MAPPAARWFGAHPWPVVASTMTRAVAEYWRVLLFPVRLMTDFGYAARIPFTPAFGAASALATAAWGAILAAGLLSVRRAPVLALGILWVFAALLPVLNVVPIGVLMAERLLYLPSVGLCVLAGHLAASALARAAPVPRRAVAAAGALVLALLAGRTVARNADWGTPLSLWEAELWTAPGDPVVNNNLAVEYTARGQPRRALERLDVALRAAPLYWRAHVNRGIALGRLGDLPGALAAFRTASAVAPGEASPHLFAGIALADRGEHAPALAELERAEGLAPEDPRPLVQAARALAALGRLAEARERLRRALALDPRDAEGRRLLDELAGR